ncbi:MAG: hypothetical protein PHE53_01780 [Thermoguttaceae bacterium]|nr:hypothetical protein [Thermoguttaceae bacterium]
MIRKIWVPAILLTALWGTSVSAQDWWVGGFDTAFPAAPGPTDYTTAYPEYVSGMSPEYGYSSGYLSDYGWYGGCRRGWCGRYRAYCDGCAPTVYVRRHCWRACGRWGRAYLPYTYHSTVPYATGNCGCR